MKYQKYLIFLIGIAAAISMAWMIAIWTWPQALFALTFDDAFYYFGIARNLALHGLSSFDGINLTNGYHPLWQFIATIPYLFGFNDFFAVKLLLCLQLVFWFCSQILLIRTIHYFRVPTVKSSFYAVLCVLSLLLLLSYTNIFFLKTFVNGLESGLTVLLYSLLFYWCGTEDVARQSQSRYRFSILLTLLFLGRTDSILLLLSLMIFGSHRCMQGKESWCDFVRTYALPLFTISLYCLLNQFFFDSPFQISGIVKRVPFSLMKVSLVAGCTIISGIFLFRRFDGWKGRFQRVTTFIERTQWFIPFIVALLGYYFTLQAQQWLWYFCPVFLYVFFVFLLFSVDLIEEAAQTSALRIIQILLIAPFICGLVLSLMNLQNQEFRSSQMANLSSARWIDRNLPSDAVLASWDAGVLGYFSNRNIVNLDGVANSVEYYDAVRSGQSGEFLKNKGVHWVVNHTENLYGKAPDIDRYIHNTFGLSSTVVYLEPFRFSGSLVGTNSIRVESASMAVFVYSIHYQ